MLFAPGQGDMVVDQRIRTPLVSMMGDGMKKDVEPRALLGGDRDHRNAQHLRETVQIDLHAAFFHHIHHVQRQNQRNVQLHELHR